MSEGKELTYGENLVGLKFNPSGDDKVSQVKKLFADVIDLIEPYHEDSHIKRILKDMAIRSCITAQMAVVKFITWQD